MSLSEFVSHAKNAAIVIAALSPFVALFWNMSVNISRLGHTLTTIDKTINGRIDHIEAGITALGEKINSMEDRLRQFGERLSRLEGRFDQFLEMTRKRDP